jgi:hypothetical protein
MSWYGSGMAAPRSEASEPVVINRRICVECAAVAPSTGGDTTLISISHGWRIVRVVAEDGRNTVEWRCPRCWTDYKAKGPPSGRRLR